MNNVNHPSHYNSGKIEVIEAIEDWKLDFPCGNAVKYVARAGKKNPDKEIEDLEKAVWYLKRKIEKLTAAKEGREAVRPNDMNPRSTSATDASNSKVLGKPTDTAPIASFIGEWTELQGYIVCIPALPYNQLKTFLGKRHVLFFQAYSDVLR